MKAGVLIWQERRIRPALRGRPPRVAICPRHIAKGPRVRILLENAKAARPLAGLLSLGSGRRIRTLTYRVRVCCATLTQSRCIGGRKWYYTQYPGKVKLFFFSFCRAYAMILSQGGGSMTKQTRSRILVIGGGAGGLAAAAAAGGAGAGTPGAPAGQGRWLMREAR